MTTGERIRSIRKAQNLTQKQLGELAGIAEPTIRRYELGKLNPKYETIEKIAVALKVSTASLLGGGSQIKYKIKQWNSRKDAHLDIAIDSKLLQTVQAIADHDGLPLEDEVEKLLLEYTDIIIEETANNPENK